MAKSSEREHLAPTLSIADYLAARTIPEPNTGCLLWLGRVNRDGYGTTEIAAARALVGSRQPFVHRVAFIFARGPIPRGHEIDHLCRVRCCINPAHLEAVPPEVNRERSSFQTAAARQKQKRTLNKRKRTLNAAGPPGHCKNGHPSSSANTVLRRGRLRCIECEREATRRHRMSITGGSISTAAYYRAKRGG